MPDTLPPKAALRQHFRDRRRQLSRTDLSAHIIHHLSQWSALQQAQVIYAYYPLAEEIDLTALTEHWPSKTWALPRCLPAYQLSWHLWTATTQLEGRRLPQPVASTPLAPPPDVVLVPTIAIDHQGTRLGFGGGYYDRYLATLPASVLRIGIAPAACISDHPLPRDPWDVPLHGYVTEAGVSYLGEQ